MVSYLDTYVLTTIMENKEINTTQVRDGTISYCVEENDEERNKYHVDTLPT